MAYAHHSLGVVKLLNLYFHLLDRSLTRSFLQMWITTFISTATLPIRTIRYELTAVLQECFRHPWMVIGLGTRKQERL